MDHDRCRPRQVGPKRVVTWWPTSPRDAFTGDCQLSCRASISSTDKVGIAPGPTLSNSRKETLHGPQVLQTPSGADHRRPGGGHGPRCAGIASAASGSKATRAGSSSTTPPPGRRPVFRRCTAPTGVVRRPRHLDPRAGRDAAHRYRSSEATAAATAAVPGATVIRAETDSSGASPYEVHMKKSDGSYVTVELDATSRPSPRSPVSEPGPPVVRRRAPPLARSPKPRPRTRQPDRPRR